MTDERYFDRAYGCLMGVALGDAMGMPSSLLSAREIKEQFGYIDRLLPAPPGHYIHDGMPAGCTTDDTAQTIAVAKTITADGGRVVPEHIGAAILQWAESIHALDEGVLALGPSSRESLKKLRAGIPPIEAGMFGETNGAPMRISPIGIIHPGDIEKAVHDTVLCCLPTHGTNVAISGAAAIACAIARAMDGAGELDGIIAAAQRGAELGAAHGRRVAASSVARRIRWAVDLGLAAANEDEALRDLYELVGATVATVETVPVALALVALAGGEPVKTAILAANLGGDCDTVGAIACSVSGAYAGIQAFPREIIRTIEETNHHGLEDVARGLLGVDRKSVV